MNSPEWGTKPIVIRHVLPGDAGAHPRVFYHHENVPAARAEALRLARENPGVRVNNRPNQTRYRGRAVNDAAFKAATNFTRAEEGGWHAPDIADPNPTMYVVIQSNYDAYRDARGLARQSVRLITDQEVADHYMGYWKEAGCDHVGPLAAAALFDAAFNQGAGLAVLFLQRALRVPEDGLIGPQTLDAIAKMDDARLAENICWERLRSYRKDVAVTPRELSELPGWVERVLAFRREFLL